MTDERECMWRCWKRSLLTFIKQIGDVLNNDPVKRTRTGEHGLKQLMCMKQKGCVRTIVNGDKLIVSVYPPEI